MVNATIGNSFTICDVVIMLSLRRRGANNHRNSRFFYVEVGAKSTQHEHTTAKYDETRASGSDSLSLY